MNEQTASTRWWNKKRIIASLLALALIIGTLTAGTFAWNAISQSALNEAKADNIIPGGRLHDDFNGTNKDVYVENYGTLPIYVRVQLSEYMEIGDGAGLKAGDTGYAVKTATSLMPGANINDTSTWSKISTNDTQFGQYWDWMMGGQKAFMPTFDKDKTSLKTDITGLNTFGITSDDYQHNVSDPLHGGTNVFGKDGSHNQYAVGDTVTDTATYKTGPVSETHTAQDTLPGTVITMAQWIANGSVPGPYWVVDTDGWAYWAQAIQPGTASGLLLNGISLNTEMDDNWYYGIFVNSDMATLNDIALLKDGTADGKNLIDIITAGQIISVTVNGPATVQAGSSENYTANVTGSNINIDKSVTWTATDADGQDIPDVTIDANGKLSTDDSVPNGTKVTITAISVQDPSKSDSMTVTLLKPATPTSEATIIVKHKDIDDGSIIDTQTYTVEPGPYGPYSISSFPGYYYGQWDNTSDPTSGTISAGETKIIIFTYTKFY